MICWLEFTSGSKNNCVKILWWTDIPLTSYQRKTVLLGHEIHSRLGFIFNSLIILEIKENDTTSSLFIVVFCIMPITNSQSVIAFTYWIIAAKNVLLYVGPILKWYRKNSYWQRLFSNISISNRSDVEIKWIYSTIYSLIIWWGGI